MYTSDIECQYGSNILSKAVSAIFIGRLIKNIICFPLEIALISIVYKVVSASLWYKKSYNLQYMKCNP